MQNNLDFPEHYEQTFHALVEVIEAIHAEGKMPAGQIIAAAMAAVSWFSATTIGAHQTADLFRRVALAADDIAAEDVQAAGGLQ